MMYSPENAKEELYRDDDPQLFEQLLAEDGNDEGAHLRLIDIALPDQFKGTEIEEEANAEFKSLRPFLVNLSRHTLEKTAKYMESHVLYDNLTKSKEDGGPKLVYQARSSYYQKEK